MTLFDPEPIAEAPAAGPFERIRLVVAYDGAPFHGFARNEGVRTVGGDSKVGFVPVSIVEDDQNFMWLSGMPDGTRVIVQGQDFVREGNVVEAVATPGGQSAQR